MKKHIVILSTGGTIVGTGIEKKTDHYEAGRMTVNDLLKDLPSLEDIAEIEIEQIVNVDSNDITAQNWLTLCNRINTMAEKKSVDGFVVTHGTDTLEETAYFLNLTIKTQKPIIITGAMRPATATSADGPFNLYQAICLACNESSCGQGVICVFSGNIYSAREVQKINNLKMDAFHQKEFSCLGYMKDEKAYFFTKTFKKHTVDSIFYTGTETRFPNVTVIPYYTDAGSEVLDYLAEHSKGIVIEGTGAGGYSQTWAKKIRELADRGIIIVRSSRVSGMVLDNKITDPDRTTIPANTLSPQKARILLMLALSLTDKLEEIRKIFEEY